MLLKDRIAIVTGAAAGIGKGVAVRFAAEGAKVALVDISEDKGKQAAAEIKKSGGEAVFIKCSVTDSSAVREMVSEVIDKFKKIDILVNNAGGVSGDAKVDELDDEKWRKVIELNLYSQFYCCKAVVPYMKKQKYGKIVNMSSMGAVSPPAPIIHYHAAKGGVLGFTRDLAVELAAFNITVNAILPGPIKTEFYTEIVKAQPDILEKLAKKVPMGRIGLPEDIAGVALFLASGLSAYVTGEAINVGGGLPLNPIESAVQ